MLKNRRSRLIPFFEKYALDAILVTDLKNIRYLCGFSGSEGALLISPDTAWFLCDSRYTEQAAHEVVDADIREFSIKYEAITTLIRDEKFGRVACEGEQLVINDFRKLSECVSPCEIIPLETALDCIRVRKDHDEICRLRSVAELSSAALMSILPCIKQGAREKDVARELEFEMRRQGAEGKAFDFIVASGERGAMPHGVASERLMQSGDLVTIDFGAVMGGYHSDETVTVSIGQPGEQLRTIHAIVREAHDRAIAAVQPGLRCCDLDAIARDYIRSCGYDKYFGHGLGHGVGLDIHEKPTISPRSSEVIVEGMVFTVEPGVYIPGVGGVRIEDTVVVTKIGADVITQVPKELLQL